MRLDVYLTKYNYFKSRTKATRAIEKGEVLVNGIVIKKTAYELNEEKQYDVKIVADKNFVSVGGFKLDKALTAFKYDVKNKICYDLGASTGGFTDCLIKNGAKKVYAVDLNNKLLDDTLKNNEKVICISKNVKNLTKQDFLDSADLIVADLSFISSDVYLGVLSNLIDDKKDIILLIKPQFEVGQKIKFKNGIIKDFKTIKSICEKVFNNALNLGLIQQNLTTVPYLENKNTEYLILLTKNSNIFVSFEQLFNNV